MRGFLLTAVCLLGMTLCGSCLINSAAQSAAERMAINRLQSAGAHLTFADDDEPRWWNWWGSAQAQARVADVDLRRAVVDDELLRHYSVVAQTTKLDVSFSPRVTDAGLEHLSPVETLRFLNVSGTSVTDAGVEAFRRKRPNCQVWRSSLPNGGLEADEQTFHFGHVPETHAFRWTATLRNPAEYEVTIEDFAPL